MGAQLRNGRDGFGFALSVAAVTALGLWVRYHDLSEQILVDDEWHGLRRAAGNPLARLFQTYFPGATSIPTNLYHRLLLGYASWTETSVRGLSVASTAATLVFLPVAIARVFGSRSLGVFVAIAFALSPFWIFYGQSSRPYAPFFLLSLCALACLHRATTRESAAAWVGFGVSGALAVYFHLFALPALAAAALVPLYRLGVAARRHGLRSRAVRRAAAVQALGYGLLLALLTAFFLPPLQNGLLERLPARQGGELFGARSLRHGLELLSGARFAALGALLVLIAAVGVWLAARKNRTFVALAGLSLLGSFAFTLATQPYDYHVALVALRYNVGAFLLYFIGLGAVLELARARLVSWARSRASRSVERWVVAAVPVAFGSAFAAGAFAVSPLPALLSMRPNNFRLHSAFQQSYGDWTDTRAYDSDMFADDLHQTAAKLPRFYRELGSAGRPCSLIEYPLLIPDAWNPFYFYQRHHGCEVAIGYSQRCPIGRILNAAPAPERIRLRRTLNLEEPAALRASGADYLVLHPDLDRENAAASREPVVSREVRRLTRALRRSFGAPIYEDGTLIVFDLHAPAP